MKPAPARRAGFTLVEMAVTLVIVSMGLVMVLEGLMKAKVSAADTHYRKVARDLALLTLGQVEAGLFWEELDGDAGTLTGTYAEEGHEDFSYELVLGDEDFTDQSERDPRETGYHDSWRAEREREDRAKKKDEDEEKTKQPFEKVRIRVTYPQLTDRESTLVLERWMPWEQVYGSEEGANAPKESPE